MDQGGRRSLLPCLAIRPVIESFAYKSSVSRVVHGTRPLIELSGATGPAGGLRGQHKSRKLSTFCRVSDSKTVDNDCGSHRLSTNCFVLTVPLIESPHSVFRLIFTFLCFADVAGSGGQREQDAGRSSGHSEQQQR